MKYTLFSYVIASIFFSQNLVAQHIKLDKKAMSFLSSEEKINVLFTFDDILFNGENLTEDDFLIHITEKITEHRDSIRAKDWVDRYYIAKDTYYSEIFVNALNVRIQDYKNPVKFLLKDSTTQYTMKVHTTWMYFGYDIGIAEQPAKINLTITFYETLAPNIIVETMTVNRAGGMKAIRSKSLFNPKGDIEEFIKKAEEWPNPSLSRMGNSYEKAGLRFGMTLKRVLH